MIFYVEKSEIIKGEMLPTTKLQYSTFDAYPHK